ncbi:hypothetical protein G7046_g899 [Stylonectria norvegica]|nr:hypothetical protein G7046_g899 [Stylonectria norvegica]
MQRERASKEAKAKADGGQAAQPRKQERALEEGKEESKKNKQRLVEGPGAVVADADDGGGQRDGMEMASCMELFNLDAPGCQFIASMSTRSNVTYIARWDSSAYFSGAQGSSSDNSFSYATASGGQVDYESIIVQWFKPLRQSAQHVEEWLNPLHRA